MNDQPGTHPDILAITKQLESAIKMLEPQDLTPAGANILRRITRTLTGGPATTLHAPPQRDAITTSLSWTDTGTWVIHTSNGAHLLDLDQRTITDINRPRTNEWPFNELLYCKVGGNLIVTQTEDGKATLQLTEIAAIEPWPRTTTRRSQAPETRPQRAEGPG